MKQIHVIIALSVFSIALLFFLSSFLPHHTEVGSSGSTGTTDTKLQLLQLREQSVRDYVSKLEQEVMKLAMDKKSDHKHATNLRPQHHSNNVMYEHSPHQNEHQSEHVLHEKPQHEEHISEQKSQLQEHARTIGLFSSSISSHKQEEHAPIVTQDTSSSPQYHSSSSDIKAVSIAIDPDFQTWQDSLKRKIHCYLTSYTNIGFYHYHVRKAAGTTIRDVVKISLQHTRTHAMLRSSHISRSHGAIFNNIKVPTYVDGYYESEGLVLHDELLQLRDVFTITSLREPISRIISLYWYEHVGWYAGILKQVERCKTFDQWLQHWRDSSTTKQEFMKKNPGNNYVEIENYYVKMLVGWQGDRDLTKEDLERAKSVLRHFDMIFITEWMEDETQIDVMNALFSGRAQVTAGHKVQGNFRMKETLKDKLAPNEEELKQELINMNQYDIELYDYAQSLMSFRLKHIIPLVEKVKKQVVKQHSIHVQGGQSPNSIVGGGQGEEEEEENLTCPVTSGDISNRKMDMLKKYKPFIGVFQPAGHKGP